MDSDIVRQASEILGTKSLRDTIDAALREVIRARDRQELVAMLAPPDRFDFAEAEHAWGGEA